MKSFLVARCTTCCALKSRACVVVEIVGRQLAEEIGISVRGGSVSGAVLVRVRLRAGSQIIHRLLAKDCL
jgi:hypothetical protein